MLLRLLPKDGIFLHVYSYIIIGGDVMYKNIKCMKNKIIRRCNKKDVTRIINELSINDIKTQKVNNLSKRLKEIIETRNLEEILEFDMKKIDEYSIYCFDVRYEAKPSCTLNPDVCGISKRINRCKLKNAKVELEEKMDMLIFVILE